MTKLCVNVDHVATVREARKTDSPDPVEAALLCEKNGAVGITIHLREDRRHIQDHDLIRMRQAVTTMLNLEMAATDEMVEIALRERPDQVTLVPEKREEVTTEGGLDVVGQEARIHEVVARLQGGGIPVSLFIDPEPEQIEASARTTAQLIELHTGRYAGNPTDRRFFEALVYEAAHARTLGLTVNAGHGLDYVNTRAVAAIEGMNELNIGHSIIARSIFAGIAAATREMADLISLGEQDGPLEM